MPVPRGGGVALVEALAGIVRDAGGALETEREVERIVVREGRATGVALAGGETIEATEAVIANVTPTQLYERLLDGTPAATAAKQPARRFRYGRAGMQIHMALKEAPKWVGDDRLGEDRDRPPDAGARRRLARRERGRPRAAARRGDDRLRPAHRRGSLARSRGRVDPLDPAPGAADARQG